MFEAVKRPMPFVVLREAGTVGDAVREALATASPEERPGLERAAELIAAQERLTDEEVQSRWVRGVLADAGITPESGHVASVKALREAVPGGIRLTDANRLVLAATEQPGPA
ncbi:hypothetical protein [Streptomyces sp. Z26]|uniref:hypothetical protein n=1 Tax=Streptomyces sp. Z26 TaxID=2500177 RepID=UPI001F0C262F|nr:hypothetical protein [Streptomyces sp. Z26]